MFQERYANAMKVFREYREGTSFINRVTRGILCAMCEAEGLSTSGVKIDLLARLKSWVRCLKFKPFVHLCIRSYTACAAHPPPSPKRNVATRSSVGTRCYGKGLERYEADRASFMDEPRTFELGDSLKGEADCRSVDGHLHCPLARYPYQALG